MNPARPVMYVCQNAVGELKIGHQGVGSKRIAEHALHGFELRLAWPASYDDEQAFHRDASPVWRIRGREYYEPVAELADWLEQMVSRGYAANTETDAFGLASIPYSVWQVAALKHPRGDSDGQMGLLQAVTKPAERIALASQWAQKQSLSDEWFTPLELVEPYQIMLGRRIDCDPASCAEANATIKADTYYTRATDGLNPAHPWFGTVWLNPPYGRGEHRAARWIERLISELDAGSVHQAVTCLNADSMSSAWFGPIWERAALQVLLRGRPNFVRPGVDGTSPTKGTVLSYFGTSRGPFMDAYRSLGYMLLPPRETRQLVLDRTAA